MEPYKSKFIDSLLREMVLRPGSYVRVLLDKIKRRIRRVEKSKYSSEQLCDYFTETFRADKIKFVLDTKVDDELIAKARYNITTNEVIIICGSIVKRILEDKFSYDSFLEDFENLVGHELVHRLQYIRDKVKKVQEYDISHKEGLIKYLSDSKEIMAHAWQIVQTFKMYGMPDKSINETLTNKDARLINYNYVLHIYRENFDSSSKVLKRLYKYIYQYLDLGL